MKSLFLKIFLSFWAALALSLVLAILVTIALRPARHGIESQGPQILAEAVNAYQSGESARAHDVSGRSLAHAARAGFRFRSVGPRTCWPAGAALDRGCPAGRPAARRAAAPP